MKTPCDIRPGRSLDGRPMVEGRYLYRVLYEQAFGPLKPGVILHHRCDNVGCVNLEHLEPMTQSQHARKHGFGGDWQSMLTHCLNGHEYTPENTYHHPTGYRQCRECTNAGKRRRRAAAKF